jgi:hypothetical protein
MSLSKQPIWSYVSNCFEGRGIAYIYLWVTKRWRVVYVGQTNDSVGTIGRACGHLKALGTFRTRFEDLVGVDLEQADDLVLISYALPREPEYTGEESSYREAVEYQVLYRLTLLRGELTPAFKLISINRYSGRASIPSVDRCAEAIVNDFQAKYSAFAPGFTTPTV